MDWDLMITLAKYMKDIYNKVAYRILINGLKSRDDKHIMEGVCYLLMVRGCSSNPNEIEDIDKFVEIIEPYVLANFIDGNDEYVNLRKEYREYIRGKNVEACRE